MTDLFAAAAAKAAATPATTKAAKAKQALTVKGDTVQKYNEAKGQRKDAEAMEAMTGDDLKRQASDYFQKQYAAIKQRPESFNLVDETGASCLFIPQSKVATITEEKAAIIKQYSPKLLVETVEFGLSPAILAKYQEQLSTAIMAVVPQEEWGDIFTTKKKYALADGAFDVLTNYVSAAKVPQLIQVLQPIYLLK